MIEKVPSNLLKCYKGVDYKPEMAPEGLRNAIKGWIMDRKGPPKDPSEPNYCYKGVDLGPYRSPQGPRNAIKGWIMDRKGPPKGP